MFTTGIFKAWFSLGDRVAAAQLAACLLGFVVVLLALERASRGRAAYHGIAPRKRAPPHRLRGAPALARARSPARRRCSSASLLPALLLARSPGASERSAGARACSRWSATASRSPASPR